MNNKKLFLLSLLTLATATIQPEDITLPKSTNTNTTTINIEFPTSLTDVAKMYAATIIPAVLAGKFTGNSIGYLSGKFFDAIINESLIYNMTPLSWKSAHLATILSRLAIQIACKYKWEKPLRNKIINWIIADLDNRSIEYNEEMMKTIARVSSWMSMTKQVAIYHAGNSKY